MARSPKDSLQTYAALHAAKTGKASDKWSSYLPAYDRLFAPHRRPGVNILEIGVQNGGSLEVLGQYFSKAEVIIGCDIDPLCANLVYDDPRLHVVVGSINSQSAYDRITALAPAFDIIIDDGSHLSLDIGNAFVDYFPLLRPGGVFIIEDTHTLYTPGYGGGLLDPASAQQFFKALTDIVNYEFWMGELDANEFLRGFFQDGRPPAFIAEGWVDRIEFSNSMIVVHKALKAGHAKLGARVVSGGEFAVDMRAKNGASGFENPSAA
jgi:hypothetical protein